MTRFAYYAQNLGGDGFRGVRRDLLTHVTGLPGWGRMIVMILALPGICLIGLSLIALAASIATLLLLTVPAYLVLRRLINLFAGKRRRDPQGDPEQFRASRRVETKVIEAGPTLKTEN